LTEAAERVEHLITHVLSQEELIQTAVAKKLADAMYDVYSAIHLLEEAQYDLQTSGDGRRMLAAQHWYRLSVKPDREREILAGRAISDSTFRSLVMFEAWNH
jgi:hypothetical protein